MNAFPSLYLNNVRVKNAMLKWKFLRLLNMNITSNIVFGSPLNYHH